MLLAARALTHLCDVLPTSCATVVHYGAVISFVDKLLTIEYMYLAEQICGNRLIYQDKPRLKTALEMLRTSKNLEDSLSQGEDEAKAERALLTLCDLHRRKVWFDDRTANAICSDSFHTSPKIMIAALSFLLNYENIEDDDSDDSSSEDESTPQHQVVLGKEAVYKANKTGTTSSKKKKKAKLQRVIRSMKKQQRQSSEKTTSLSSYSPFNHLNDA
ncbi:hypothetical protein AgCh_035947 [Apium graveolens]